MKDPDQVTSGSHFLPQQHALPAKLIWQPPVKIDTMMTKDQFVALARHMLNENPISHFLVVHRDGDGAPRYSKAPPGKRADTHADWAFDTIIGKARIKTSLGFYPKKHENRTGKSLSCRLSSLRSM